MGKVECLSETLNTTLETMQNKIQQLSSTIFEHGTQLAQQKFDISQLTTTGEGQQIEIERLLLENIGQGTQLAELAEHQLDIERYVSLYVPQSLSGCTASVNQTGYNCLEAIDGITNVFNNGWAYLAPEESYMVG